MIPIDLGFEIDMLPVDSGTKNGDAIAIRYGSLKTNPVNPKIIVIDGGTLESGENLVAHVQEYYKTDRVDLMISTHPDNDHCSGLRKVMENLTVKELWVHTPWYYPEKYIGEFHDGRLTENSLTEKLKEGLEIAHELETIANERKIIVREPFAGLSYDSGKVLVLGPSSQYYHSLVPQFRTSPELKEGGGVLTKAMTAVIEGVKLVMETMQIETLNDAGVTSAENNSSVITLLQLGAEKLLFTGDAGIEALTKAEQFAASIGISLKGIRWMQMPHHGSRRNVGPTILNKVMAKDVYVSVSKDSSDKHPAKKVVNAFIRRGANVFQTNGSTIWHNFNAPARPTFFGLTPLPFSNEVEE